MVSRMWSLCAGLVALLAQPTIVMAAPQQAEPVANDIGRAFVGTNDFVDVDHGRRINRYCIGQGRVPVVFSSGLSDWSSIWALVQPAIGQRTRACSYDRAGLGYSDPAHRPATPIAAVEDLHALLHRSGTALPAVLVGHSMGGFYAKLYAALYPADVAGLVLVDPAEERNFARSADALSTKFGRLAALRYQLQFHTDLAEATASYAECADAARAHEMDPASPLYGRCTDPVRPRLGPAIAAARQSIQVRSAYQSAQASEIANSPYMYHGDDDAYRSIFAGDHTFGSRPLIVLSRSLFDQQDEGETMEHFQDVTLHQQTAALSMRGVHRVVPNTHHNIQIDQPKVVVDAINEVLNMISGNGAGRAR